MADTAGGLKQVFLRDFPTTVVLCWATVGLLDRKSAPVRRVLAALVLGAFILTTLLSGWRGQLFTAALLPIVYFHYRVRRLRLGEVALAGVGAYILVNALSVMRLTSNISEMVGLLNAEAADRGMTFLKLSQSGELATSSNLLRLIVGIQDGETHYMWGGLLGSQLGSVVPRAFWLDRPPLGNELFVQVFYPGVYESGGGFAFFILQDGYWDFGLPGVVLYSAVFALGLRWLYDQLVVRRRGALWPLLYAVLFGQLVLSSVRTGLLASVKEASMAALPLLTVWFIDAVARARRKLEQAGT
jgi:oligosaccharide repeat unit polymerase